MLYPPLAGKMAKVSGELSTTFQTFGVKTYEVTTNIESACILVLCLGTHGWQKRVLTLEAEEAILKTDNNCTHSISKRPYAQVTQIT